ncbi:hypothetical protein HMPREF1584_00907 [Gardnerella vaginalis JCP8481A]|nr:hypothetical protein HMPREF1584_00907 [Gardnerella vaginalis JCP8481A]
MRVVQHLFDDYWVIFSQFYLPVLAMKTTEPYHRLTLPSQHGL